MQRKNLLPPDPTVNTVRIIDAVAVSIYQKLDDPTDKFIVSMVFEIGYTREDTARALGVTYQTVYNRINKIKELLMPKDFEV